MPETGVVKLLDFVCDCAAEVAASSLSQEQCEILACLSHVPKSHLQIKYERLHSISISPYQTNIYNMAEKAPNEIGEPPSVAALSIAATATMEPTKAKEQIIDPWSVEAGVDEQGNALEFDYEAISR